LTVHVLFVTGGFSIGGTEVHLLALMEGLTKRGFRVTAYQLARGGALESELTAVAETVVDGSQSPSWCRHFPPGLRGLCHLLAAGRRLSRLITQINPTIVHSFLPFANIVTGFATLLVGFPRVAMSRRSLRSYPGAPRWQKIIEPIFLRRAQIVLGNSGAVVNDIELDGVSQDKIRLIYNGVTRGAQSKSGASIRDQENISDDTVIITCVANLIPYKGHQDLLEAMSLVSHTASNNWRLLLIGAGEPGYLADLQSLCRRLGLEQKVSFLGQRSDLGTILEQTNVAVLASHTEGFSNALLEYMFSGCATIATDVGGNAEAVEHQCSGLIVPAHAPRELAQAISQLIADEDLRTAYAVNAKARAASKFSQVRCIDAYVECYSSMIDRTS